VIGYIEDSRPGGTISMAGRNKGIAAQARAAGADGIIINSDNKEFMGTVSNGFVNGWAYGTSFGANGFGTTVPVFSAAIPPIWRSNTSETNTTMIRMNSNRLAIEQAAEAEINEALVALRDEHFGLTS
jgi:hypothetical protein